MKRADETTPVDDSSPVHAVPIHYGDLAQTNDGIQIGSGFLAGLHGKQFLVSAAHIPFGAPSQTNDWSTWPATVSVHIPGHHVPLDLFGEVDGNREPKFGYHLDPDGVRLIDLMWLPLDQYPTGFVGALASRYHTFDLNENVTPLPGERVTCYGYPSADPWPFEMPSRQPARSRRRIRFGSLLTPRSSAGSLVDP